VGRYFFDIHDGSKLVRDPEGHECTDINEVRLDAMRTLPEIAKQEIPRLAADAQAFTVVVRDEARETVYTATLTFAGLKMETPIPTE
jgi:hypothetical protein